MQLARVFLCLLVLVPTLHAQETLTLAAPEIVTVGGVWQVRGLYVDVDAPNIEVTLKSETGSTFVWRYAVCTATAPDPCPVGTGTLAQVNGAIRTINRGEFQTKHGMSLNAWILDRMNVLKVKIGTVGGTTP